MKNHNVPIYDRDGIPPQVINFAGTMLAATSSVTAKENSKLTLMSVKKYCEDMLAEYEKQALISIIKKKS